MKSTDFDKITTSWEHFLVDPTFTPGEPPSRESVCQECGRQNISEFYSRSYLKGKLEKTMRERARLDVLASQYGRDIYRLEAKLSKRWKLRVIYVVMGLAWAAGWILWGLSK